MRKYVSTCLVPLQAKNPKTSMSPPSAERGTECPGIGTARPFLSNLPIRGPIKTQPVSAQTAAMKDRATFVHTVFDAHNVRKIGCRCCSGSFWCGICASDESIRHRIIIFIRVSCFVTVKFGARVLKMWFVVLSCLLHVQMHVR